jgi:hypothetical protein
MYCYIIIVMKHLLSAEEGTAHIKKCTPTPTLQSESDLRLDRSLKLQSTRTEVI